MNENQFNITIQFVKHYELEKTLLYQFVSIKQLNVF